MRTDDPRLEKSRERLFERVKKYDEMMLTVIKNHLGCEQFLNELLSTCSKPWKKKRCAGKIDIAKKLNLTEIEPPIWEMLEAGNRLRNQIAHSPDQSKIASKMAVFRKAYLAALTPEQAKGSESLDDIRIVVMAFGLCGGYLVAAADRLAAEKKEKHANG